jgi:hypothetical protein
MLDFESVKSSVILVIIGSLFVFFSLSEYCFSAENRDQIKYYSTRIEDSMFSTLKATVNGKEYTLIDKKAEKCLILEEQRDFDNNGSMDALVTSIDACGGNCCPNSFFFVTYKGKGEFVVSDDFGSSRGNLKIENWKGKPSIVMIENNEGYNLEQAEEIKYRYVLDTAGQAEVAEYSIRKHIPSLRDMKSTEFEFTKSGEYRKMEFDLNGDSKMDLIKGELYERWGRIIWSVTITGMSEITSEPHCKRIGILSTKTAGFHDIVCDFDKVLHWDGKKYL